MKQLPNILIVLLALFLLVSAQIPITLLPVATDSTKNEIEPYLTYYWYDGNFSWNNSKGSNYFNSPLWLVYVEIDSVDRHRVIARNLSVDGFHNVSFSEKMVISDTTLAVEVQNPILENFLGNPVAIWEQYENGRVQLFYSRGIDSLWTTPQKIGDSPSDQNSAVLVTKDAFSLPGQTDTVNSLFFVSDSMILGSSLKPDYTWRKFDTLLQAQHPISNLKARINNNEDLWLIFDEFPAPDSVVVKACIREDSSGNWVGPFDVLHLDSASQANIHLDAYSWNNNILRLGWVENRNLHEKRIWYENDSLHSDSIGHVLYNPSISELKCVSNNLLPGGCVIAPFPWYFTAGRTDSLYSLSLYPGQFDQYSFRDSVSFVDNMSISGLTNDHFLLAWNEKTFDQKDIYLYLFYIPIGETEDAVTEQPRMFRLFQNYPNPFNSVTTVKYFLPKAEPVRLEIYNLLGQRVRTLVSGQKPAGEHQVSWDGRDDAGREVAGSVYIYRLTAGGLKQSRKLVLLR